MPRKAPTILSAINPGRRVMVLAAAMVLVIGGCSGGDRREVLVSAAASLTDAFAEIEAAFEETNPGYDVVLNFGGSSTLREQIEAGAPVDVFASADSPTMDLAFAAGDALTPRVFAANRLQIATAIGNPAGVTGIEDFARSSPLFGVCAPPVPCGGMANLMFAAARIVPSIDTEEPNVRALLTKIEAGELDAGIVYVTDVVAAGGAVDGIVIPDDRNVFTDYPIAVMAAAPHPEGAEAFLAFVLSPAGQAILADHGFITP
jgi:molybdate transport system substrate-binding protein